MNASFLTAHARLRAQAGSATAPVLLTGPRQVGKTTLLLELARERGQRASYITGDNPMSLLPQSWTRFWEDAEHRAASGQPVTVMLDEIQLWPMWRERLGKTLAHIANTRLPIHVIATASAELDGHQHGRESLAFDRIRISHWSASAVAATFRVEPAAAAEAIVSFGGYPGAYQFMTEPERWAAYVRDSIIEPALSRDAGALAPIRQPALLRQVCAIAALHPCETISLQRMQAVLLQTGALTTIAGYLRLLEAAGLVASLPRHSTRKARLRSAPPKLVVLNNAVLSALHPAGSPDRAREPARHDVWIENACLAHAINAGQRVSYWREEPFDVDAVIEGDWGKWAIEVMPDVHSTVDYRGLHEFVARYPDYQPLVVTSEQHLSTASRAGLAAKSWQQFLITGPGDRAGL